MKVFIAVLLFVIVCTNNPVFAPKKTKKEELSVAEELDTKDFQPRTHEEWKEEINNWINDYFVRFDKIQKEKKFSKNTDMTIVKELMLYNWMHYLNPKLTKHVQNVLPEYLKNEKTTESIEKKIEESIHKHGEESVTLAIIRYQCAEPPMKSIHDQVMEELKKSLESLFGAVIDKLKKMTLDGDRLKVYETMKDREIANDPIILVHELDLLMCLQSVYIVFYPNYEEETWALKATEVNGIMIEMTSIETSYLTQKTLEFFSELEHGNIKEEILKGIMETLKVMEGNGSKKQ